MSDKQKLSPVAKAPYTVKGKEHRKKVNQENWKKAVDTFKDGRNGYEKPKTIIKKPLEETEYDMFADIYDPRAVYPPEVKIKAAQGFMLTGSVTKAASIAGLPKQTVSRWKVNSEWWPAVLAHVRKEKQDELDANFTDVIHKSVGKLQDRLEHGEEVIVKTGDSYEKVKKDMSGRDISHAIDVLYRNRAALRGDPTSITRKENPADMLNKLKEAFEGMAEKAARKEIDKKVVN